MDQEIDTDTPEIASETAQPEVAGRGARGGTRRREVPRPDEDPPTEVVAVPESEPTGPALLGVDAFDRQDTEGDEASGVPAAP